MNLYKQIPLQGDWLKGSALVKTRWAVDAKQWARHPKASDQVQSNGSLGPRETFSA